MGPVIAYTGAHPILVSLSMMIFLRGLGEFLTRGGDISGFPEFIQPLGHGSFLGIPIPLLILLGAVVVWHVLMSRTRLGFATYMIGSNIEATRYSGHSTRRVITLIYALSGAMCAVAGIIMLARFNSVRVGHGEVLSADHRACLLSRRRQSVRRFRQGGLGLPCAGHPAGPVLGAQPARAPTSISPPPSGASCWSASWSCGGSAGQLNLHEDRTMKGFGVHTSMWTMGWTVAGAENAVAAAKKYEPRLHRDLAARSAFVRRCPYAQAARRQTTCRRSARLACPNMPGRRSTRRTRIDFLKVAIDKTADMGGWRFPASSMAASANEPACRRPRARSTTSRRS